MSEQSGQRRDPRLLSSSRRGPSWVQRAIVAAVGVSVAVAAFFFLAIALVAAVAIALIVGVRLWWVMRRVRAEAAASAPLEGEYSVIERSQLERPPRER